MATRYLEKFESISGSISYTFPLKGYEWTSEQNFRTPYGTPFGGDYAHDYQGYLPGAKEIARETIRCIAVESSATNLEAEIDEARNELQRIGLGKLYTIDSDGSTRRWAYARAVGLPGMIRGVGQVLHIPLTFGFNRISDWFATSATTGSQLIDASPKTFTISNGGNIPAKFITFRLRANAAGGFTNPALFNDTPSTATYSIATTRDSVSTNSEIRIDTEKKTVEFSDNDGSTYADDFALVTLGSTQVGFFVLEPGNNSCRMTMDGTPNSTLEWSFYAPYA